MTPQPQKTAWAALLSGRTMQRQAELEIAKRALTAQSPGPLRRGLELLVAGALLAGIVWGFIRK